ncbi:GNAT family N-acetyltransferase [Nocardioides pacificus]
MSPNPILTRGLPPGYRLVEEAPGVDDYLRLRAESGLSPRTREQAERALAGHWAAVTVLDESTGQPVAMGRVLGDGGWYFHIVDMAVLPDHQRRGLGARVLESLLARIDADAPPDPYVTLMGDEPGRRLYASYGFEDPSPRTVGMVRTRPPAKESR